MSIRPGCTLRPPEKPNILGGTDTQALPQSGPSPVSTAPDAARAEAVRAQAAPAAEPPTFGAKVAAAGDTSLVTGEDFPYFRRKLHEQLAFVRSTMLQALQRANTEHYAQIAGQVHDAQDESLADLLVGVSFNEIDRDVQAVRDIDAAQRRILSGSYGRCLACGEPISFKRLDAYPTAKRCLDCQVRHERRGKPTPRL